MPTILTVRCKQGTLTLQLSKACHDFGWKGLCTGNLDGYRIVGRGGEKTCSINFLFALSLLWANFQHKNPQCGVTPTHAGRQETGFCARVLGLVNGGWIGEWAFRLQGSSGNCCHNLSTTPSFLTMRTLH